MVGTAVPRKRIDDQERSELAFGLGAVSGNALVLTDDIGSGKQETERAAAGRPLGRHAGVFWQDS